MHYLRRRHREQVRDQREVRPGRAPMTNHERFPARTAADRCSHSIVLTGPASSCAGPAEVVSPRKALPVMSIQSLLRRAGLRAAAITAASALVLVGVANSASAHVTVSSPDA